MLKAPPPPATPTRLRDTACAVDTLNTHLNTLIRLRDALALIESGTLSRDGAHEQEMRDLIANKVYAVADDLHGWSSSD